MTKEERNAYMREYYRNHRKSQIERACKYSKEHKEERTAYKKELRHRDIEKTRKTNNEYYAKNRVKILARRKELRDIRKNNKEEN